MKSICLLVEHVCLVLGSQSKESSHISRQCFPAQAFFSIFVAHPGNDSEDNLQDQNDEHEK